MVPGSHLLPEQQPEQLVGVHWGGGIPQVPLTHCCPDGHCLHWLPLLPQWEKVVPGWHLLLEQQPEQLAGVQVGGGAPQTPPLQACPVWHALQFAPFLPQRWNAVPGWHF